jgi:uncharacterized small protein (TIGR04563 family)
MASPDKRKQSLYFPNEMLEELQAEASRRDRSLSWVVQQAWRIAKVEIRRIPAESEAVEKAADRKAAA